MGTTTREWRSINLIEMEKDYIYQDVTRDGKDLKSTKEINRILIKGSRPNNSVC